MTSEVFQITNDPSVTLTSYVIDSSQELATAEPRPAILVLPGGGYHFCSDREAEPIALAYLAHGYNAFVLRYSLNAASAFPRPLQDAETALEFIGKHSAEWHVDPKKIAAIGFSAGGHLAAALGTMGKIKPAALILAYPCILASIGDVLANPVPSLDEKVDASTPPAFIWATAADALVPVENSLAFATALSRAKIPFELHIFKDGVHGLSLATAQTSNGNPAMLEPDAAQWVQLSVSWLQKTLKAF
jgi:acetyl esterase/lipase